MTMTPIRRHVAASYAFLGSLVGREVTVVASVLDGHGGVPLTVECLSTPVCWAGTVTFCVRLTCPLSTQLVPALYEVHHGDSVFDLALTEVARDARFVHYEAYLTEPH